MFNKFKFSSDVLQAVNTMAKLTLLVLATGCVALIFIDGMTPLEETNNTIRLFGSLILLELIMNREA